MRIIATLLTFMLGTAAWAQAGATSRQLQADGARWLGQGQHEQALRAYQAALDLATSDDDRALALLGIANTHRARHDSGQQLAALRQALALRQASAAYLKVARQTLLWLYLERSDLVAARTVAEELLKQDPRPDERVNLTLNLAQMDLQEGKAQDAAKRLQALQTEARDTPAWPDVLALLARAQAASDHPKDAVATAQQALKQFPDRLDILTQTAAALADRGLLGEGTGLLREALVARPQQAELLRTFYDLCRRTDQVKLLTDWLGKQAKGAAADLWLGYLTQVHEWEGQFPQALEATRQLLELRPNDLNLLQSAAQLALRAEDMKRAGEWLERALAQRPGDQGLQTLLGETQLRQGKLQTALATWRQAFGYDPQQSQTVEALGSTLMRYELYEAALEVYREGRQAAGRPGAYALNMGTAYSRLGQLPEAVQEYVTALVSPDRGQFAGAAGNQLYRLAEDEAARPAVLAELSAVRQRDALPLDGVGALLYAQTLRGDDPAKLLAALAPGDAETAVLPTVLQIANRLEARQEPELALPFYEWAMRQPAAGRQSVGMTRRIAELQLAAGNWRGALKTLEQALPKLPATGPAPLRAELALQLGDVLLRYGRRPADAVGAYEIAVKAAPGTRTALLAQWGQADAQFALGEYAVALEEYQRLLKAGAGEAEIMVEPFLGGPARVARPLPAEDFVAYHRLEADLRQGKLAESAAGFHQFAAERPQSAYANDALERVLLAERLQSSPAEAPALLAGLKGWAAGDAAAAAQALAPLAGDPPGKLGDAALMLLAEMRMWADEPTEAVQLYDRVLASCADSPSAPRAAFTAAMVTSKRDRATARTRLQALVDRYPDSTEAGEAQIVLQAWDKQAAAQP